MILVLSCGCLCPIHWNQVLSWEWRCSWSSADRRCCNYIWVINSCIAYNGTPYVRGLAVCIFKRVIIIVDSIMESWVFEYKSKSAFSQSFYWLFIKASLWNCLLVKAKGHLQLWIATGSVNKGAAFGQEFAKFLKRTNILHTPACFHPCFQTLGLGRVFRSWWRHQMETFSALPAICAGNSPTTGEYKKII